jgi:septum formation protein
MFILASASASRKGLLKGYKFRVVPSDAREVKRKTLRASVLTNAKLKAAAVSRLHPDDWVLAADTLIAYGGKVYGKPRDRKAAVRLWTLLAGKTHTLMTGVVLRKGKFEIVKVAESKVTVRANPPIAKILRTLDPTRYAGGYRIKPKNDPLIERIEGSRSNVIGLPLEIVEPLLKNLR